jgi:PDZ domain-containing protein
MSEEATPDATLPSSDVSPVVIGSEPRRLLGGRPARLLVVAVVAVLTLATGFFTIPAQWVGRVLPGDSVIDDGAVALKPGSAIDTAPRVAVADLEVFEPEGEILFMTVVVDDQVSLADWVFGTVRDGTRFLPRDQVFGTRSTSEERAYNLEMMQVAKNTAVVAALEFLGVDAVVETGVGFGEVAADGPARDLLEPGEVIVALDGEPVTTLASLLELLAVRPGGTKTVLTVEGRDGVVRDERVTLGDHPDRSGSGFIGIAAVMERIEEVPLPFVIDIDSGAIGGPSAGLAFALAIVDLVTDGELTGGRRIAVTGTISVDAMVGPVGGVTQKAKAAERSGADYFVVPIANLDDARQGADQMEVVGVSTLSDAIDALTARGGETEALRLNITV